MCKALETLCILIHLNNGFNVLNRNLCASKRHMLYLSLNFLHGLQTLNINVSSPGSNRSCGVGILINNSFSIDQSWHDTDGRYTCVELSKQNFVFRLHCIYGPNTKNEGMNFFGSLFRYIDPLIPNFFCGDFNTVLDPVLDRAGCNPSSPWAYNSPTSYPFKIIH